MNSKQLVRDFWNEAACGEDLLLESMDDHGFLSQAAERYRLEPYIVSFANFTEWRDQDVLEIGLGLGADHERFAEAGARLHGIDLTPRAVEVTQKRFALRGLMSKLQIGDAEFLPYPDSSFDLVYSWGVIHHSPDTAQAAEEILRVLRPGGEFRVMIYHKHSLVGFMLWIRYALLRGRLWMTLDKIYAQYLESPGTKAYTIHEAKALFCNVTNMRAHVELTHGDLLESGAGQRHEGWVLTLARHVWPRNVLRLVAKRFGLFLLISGRKQA